MFRQAFRWFGGAALGFGLLFYLAGGDTATSAARTGWYIIGSGIGVTTHTTSSMTQGLDDAKAANKAADAEKSAEDKVKP